MHALKLLGGAVLEGEDGSLSGPATRRHPIALLALLATAPSRTLSRGKLVGLLWPETTEKKARNRLNTCVHQIRSALGRNVLVSVGDDLRLDTDVLSCDVCAFEAALERGNQREAVDLYQGPFLDGFHLGDAAAFEKRVDQLRARLRRDYLAAQETLAEAHEERGELGAAARRWRQRADEDPYDSRVTTRLMEALAEAGNRVEALRVAHRHARRLEEDFGTEPDAEVRRLAARLKEAPDEPSGREEAHSGGAPSGAGRTTEAEIDGRGERRAGPGAPSTDRIGSAAGPTAGEPESREALASEGRPAPSGFRGARGDGFRSRLALGSLLAIGLLAAAAVVGWYLVGGGDRTASVGDRTVAVLPFDGGDGDTSLLTGGIYGAVLTELSMLSDLTVVSPTTGRQLDSAGRPFPEAAGQLGVSWTVDGTVTERDGAVEVTVRLVETRTGEPVWTGSYQRERTAEAVFGITADITRRIVETLHAELTPAEERRLQDVPTQNTAALELYLEARRIDRSPGAVPENVDQKIRLYERALELDPEFAEAWAWLADAYVERAWLLGETEGWADSAVVAATRALDIDPEVAAAYAQLGDAYWTLGGRSEETLEAYRRALELRPNDREAANNLVIFLGRRGRLGEKAKWLETLRRTSPESAGPIASLAALNAELGRDSVARAWIEHGRARGHDLIVTELWLGLFEWGDVDRVRELLEEVTHRREDGRREERLRAALALFEGDWREARRRYRGLYTAEVGPVSSPLFHGLLYDGVGLGVALDRLGDPEAAREIAREVVGLTEGELVSRDSSYVPRHRMAAARLLLGDTVAALELLEEAVDVGYRGPRTMRTIPVLEPLRGHPRFQALLERTEALIDEELRVIEENGWGIPPRTGG